jgi:hypothetical protein
MADTKVDDAVKTTVAVGAGGLAGGTILAPVAMGAAAALGMVVAPWAVIPIFGASILLGMWGGKKVKEAASQ